MSSFFINLDKDFLERFEFGRFMEFSDNFDTVTSRFLLEVPGLPKSGEYKVVSEPRRPDLISFRIYGTPDLWWILMHYNNIVDIDDIVIDTLLEYPSIDDLDELFFDLKSQEVASP